MYIHTDKKKYIRHISQHIYIHIPSSNYMYTWSHLHVFMRRLKHNTTNIGHDSLWQKNHSRNRDLFNKKHIKVETSIYRP